MKAEVRRFIRRHGLLPEQAPVLVAVSGGVDSIVLLDVLRTLGHRCTVVHVDHGLRGAASEADRAFVEEHCAALGVACAVRRVSVNAGKGTSVQMAARALRLEALRSVALELDIAQVALAHHQDDALETFLIELMRGGLTTIPARSGPFIRPLLGVGRSAIEAHARAHGLLWREDASNTDPKYLRNRVRHELLPLIEALSPGARRVMGRALDRLRAQQRLAHGLVDRTILDSGDAMPLEALRDPAFATMLMQRWLRPLGFHPDQLDQLRDAVDDGHIGATFQAGGHRVTVDREALLHTRITDAAEPVHVAEDLRVPAGVPFHFERCTAAEVDLAQGPLVAWLDASKLRFPLELRPWRPGDRMRPIGLGGSKLVSDILTDAHVPRPVKERAWVLLSGGEVVWLAGHRIAEGAGAGGEGPVLQVRCTAA